MRDFQSDSVLNRFEDTQSRNNTANIFIEVRRSAERYVVVCGQQILPWVFRTRVAALFNRDTADAVRKTLQCVYPEAAVTLHHQSELWPSTARTTK